MNQSFSRVQKLIFSLDQEEKQHFSGWLKNELREEKSDVLRWAQELAATDSFTIAWEKAFPGQLYNDGIISRLNFVLTEWLEEYISIEAFRKDPFAKALYLNRFVIRRAPEDLYGTTIKKTRKRLESKEQPIRDYTFFRLQFELDRLDAEYQNLFPGNKIRRYIIHPEIVEKNEELQLLLSQAELSLKRLSNRTALNPYDHLTLERLKVYAENTGEQEIPLINLYQQLFIYLENREKISSQQAEELIALYQRDYACLRPDGQFTIAIHIQNVLIRSIYQDNRSSLYEILFDFYRLMLEKGETFGSRYFYQNLIQICLQLAQRWPLDNPQRNILQEKARSFLEEYKPSLPQKDQEEAYQYNLAHIYFTEGQFDK
ncbi:MAG: hypothetical protein KDD63_14890, partial [Bacteroidetes bacterium]|nr:hypothetical protein [Bacteroidota bacterium]